MLYKVAGSLSGLISAGMVVGICIIFAFAQTMQGVQRSTDLYFVCDDVEIATDLVVGGFYEDPTRNSGCRMEDTRAVDLGDWIAEYTEMVSGEGYLSDVELYHATVCGKDVIVAVGFEPDPHFFDEDAGLPLIAVGTAADGCSSPSGPTEEDSMLAAAE